MLTTPQTLFTFAIQNGGSASIITVRGRTHWALMQLIEAGATGITTIENPAPRWAAYVHQLRQLGVRIETITERHSDPFPGNHARYVLRSNVRAVKP
ncbi:winged helix domain-containing protein [Aliiroseovarius sp. KMU-71]|uniref:winged helix domain-containing protein n=1 Tax=Aliiroseovarius sp. KMU-71 TaxID=3453123 RepID=UPI003F471C24